MQLDFAFVCIGVTCQASLIWFFQGMAWLSLFMGALGACTRTVLMRQFQKRTRIFGSANLICS